MDKRLELTNEQKLAVENYKQACKQLKAANVKAIYRVDELYLINGNNVIDIDFADCADEDMVEVEFDDLTCYDCPYDFGVGFYDEESFAVKFD